MIVKSKKQLNKSITKEAILYIIENKTLICTIGNMSHIITRESDFSGEKLDCLMGKGQWFVIEETDIGC